MRSASIVAMTLLAVQPAGGEESLIERWQDKPSILVAYVAGMRRYKVALDEGGSEVPQVLLDGAGINAGALPWTWVAANGDWLRREEEGRFRMSSGNYLGNWFTEIDCRVTEWPTLDCEDGKTRKMSVSDVNTIVVDDVQYRRAPARSQ